MKFFCYIWIKWAFFLNVIEGKQSCMKLLELFGVVGLGDTFLYFRYYFVRMSESSCQILGDEHFGNDLLVLSRELGAEYVPCQNR